MLEEKGKKVINLWGFSQEPENGSPVKKWEKTFSFGRYLPSGQFHKSGFGGNKAETKEEENKLAMKNMKLQTEDIFPGSAPVLPGDPV